MSIYFFYFVGKETPQPPKLEFKKKEGSYHYPPSIQNRK